MTTHHFDITAIPQADMRQSEVISLIIQGLHDKLPAFAGRVGLAFPGYRHTLGGIVRVFGVNSDLDTLHDALLDAGELIDYAMISAVAGNPSAKGYVCFTRKHRKGASDIRRAKKRLTAQGLPAQEIDLRLQNMCKKILASGLTHTPHVHLKSRSTGQKMLLCVSRHSKQKAQTGHFSSYGLSDTATVPDF